MVSAREKAYCQKIRQEKKDVSSITIFPASILSWGSFTIISHDLPYKIFLMQRLRNHLLEGRRIFMRKRPSCADKKCCSHLFISLPKCSCFSHSFCMKHVLAEFCVQEKYETFNQTKMVYDFCFHLVLIICCVQIFLSIKMNRSLNF